MWLSHGKKYLLPAQCNDFLIMSREYKKKATLSLQTATAIPALDNHLEEEAKFTSVIRMKNARENYFVPQFYSK